MPVHADAAVVGGCLLAFDSIVDLQDQQDIQDCLLYSELTANDKYPQHTSQKVWFDCYKNQLLEVGFTLEAMVHTEPFRVTSVPQLLRTGHEVIVRLGSKRMGELFEHTYRALELDKFAWEFFHGNVMHGGLGILKCAPCERLASGKTVVCLFGMRVSTTVTEQDFFFWKEFDKRVLIVPDGGVYAFKRKVFEDHRAQVHEKIEAYSERLLVHKLKL
ncbi:hypothetical protein [Pseudomonas izuensis]|uniref:Uncharacterized protein n=1 Tax=Pseudomonas izuensis TaxID=2684212 RepID=A0ABM7RU62_9PSED|nr:hypothetical protein [Pseudomonas izuensis]BCX65961.1 hypothetical protein LAB08_R05680 [Pseudomonas izuensis]